MRRPRSWFEFGLALFGGAVPIGVATIVLAPFDFFHALGVGIVAMGLIGLWVSALGLRLEHPERWAEIRAAFGRHATDASQRPAAPR